MDNENNKELNNYITKYYNRIDNIYIDKFWSSINNKHWIYVDDVLIEWIGYNKTNGKQKYINLIKYNFKENDDYKTYNYEEINKIFHSPPEMNEDNKEIIEFKDKLKEVHNRTLHLILSPKCFKKSLMIIRTERANTIRDYYVDIEEICLEFNKYLLENKNQELEENKKELENKNQELEEKETIINKQKDKIMDMERDFEHTELEFDEFIYIATNKNYHKQNVYKIGRSARLNKRTKQFNTFFINGHKIFYIYVFQCHKSRILEQLLFTCLDKYKYCKINELFHLELNKLLSIVFNIGCQYNKIINYTNEFLLSNNEVKILNDDNITSQIFPINYKNIKIDTYDEELLKKYANNKNICNMIAKEFVDFDYEDHILLNNKALSIDTNTKYYYLTYYNKIIYICTNCGCFKKDKRSYEQHIRKRNKCITQQFNLNSIEDIENELMKQKIKLYLCEKCPETIFKTYDHYKRHIEYNCKLIK